MSLSRISGLIDCRRAWVVASLTALLGCTSVWSQPADPCAYKEIDVDKYGHQELRNPPDIVAPGGALTTTLEVQYTDPKSISIAGCPVTLRTYNGQLVGPTLRVRSGDVMNVRLDNRLPRETPNEVQQQYVQESGNAFLATQPNSFNTTNLHTHGLHVSPSGNSDNVLLAIGPQTSFPYEIKLPRNHPAGSFWYHAHAHGSTSIQVGSGMAGALVIEDDETKIPLALREANKREKVLVFQTILYNTRGRLDDITALFPSAPTPSDCTQSQYKDTWTCAKRRITINGQIVPIIKMQPGEVQRWRMIDTAFRETINVQLEGHALNEIALDGLYLGRVDTWPAGSSINLAPGYRSDVLVQANAKPGKYRLLKTARTAELSLRSVAESESVLAIVEVAGQPMQMQLPTSAEMAPLAPFPGVDLSKMAADPADKSPVGLQNAVFEISGPPKGNQAYFQINYQAFNPTRNRQLILNGIDQWQLIAVGAPHVFHIHVNPFQYSRIGPDGQPEMVWKDTLLLPKSSGIKPIIMYTRYLDYIGQFVMHCHILDHEDLGMMEVDEVVPDTSGLARSHHH